MHGVRRIAKPELTSRRRSVKNAKGREAAIHPPVAACHTSPTLSNLHKLSLTLVSASVSIRVFAGTAECVAWSEEIQPVQRIANSIPVVLFDLLPKRVSAVIFVGN